MVQATPWYNDFGGGGAQYAQAQMAQYAAPEDSSSSEEVTLQTIIRDKPKPRVVRQFMRDYLANIRGEDEVIFG